MDMVLCGAPVAVSAPTLSNPLQRQNDPTGEPLGFSPCHNWKVTDHGQAIKLPLPPVLIAAVLLLVVELPVAYLAWPAPTPPPASLSATAIESVRVLRDQQGAPVAENWPTENGALVFFGFTHCADICPTTLIRVRDALNQLEDSGRQPTPTFITLDPERDTMDRLKAYLGFFDPRIRGLTGTSQQIGRIVETWGLYARRVDFDNTYLLDHTTALFLLDNRGELLGVLSGQLEAAELARRIRQLMDGG